jgi:uncharacterized RDD family membrane protein YckC
MASWYFVRNGERVGPLGREEFDARIAEGAVRGDSLVWRAGMASWARACELGELGLPPPVPPPPLPPPLPPAPERAMNPFGAGVTAMEREAPDAKEAPANYGGFWVRLAAKFFDRVILYGVAMLVERAVVELAFAGVAPEPMDWPQLWRLIAIVAPINILIALAYTVYFMLRHEATPGKLILGLRVVRADGSRLGVGRIVGRFFAEMLSAVIFLTGYVMAAFDERKRTLHDYLCDTRVVKGPRED